MLRIGIDISSGERSPLEIFEGVLLYKKENKDDDISIFVDEEFYNNNLDYFKLYKDLNYVISKDKVLMEDKPSVVIKNKKDSSMVKGIKYLEENKIDAFFSPGNTGALITASDKIIGKLKHFEHSAISVFVPNVYGEVILLDAGANYLVDDDTFVNHILLISFLYEKFTNKKSKIGILNIGKESYKGPKWVKKVAKTISRIKKSEFYGFVEGNDLLTSDCNIFVTDGYTGNILLKGIESVFYYIKKNIMSIELIEALKNLKLEYSSTGCGIILGFNKPVFIGHGVTDKYAVYNAIKFIKKFYSLNIDIKEIASEIIVGHLIRKIKLIKK
ncbi:MAG TPA: hypothetical protein PKW55_03695 [Spirochaetota bacterium]|nr:hypothetical protein [Spirochaetota bacterium]HOM38062.1 hypothetical protein [Spirochaetota bacterium]HPQ48865.1 hypothetical protein [Spirochaetota bacterium]